MQIQLGKSSGRSSVKGIRLSSYWEYSESDPVGLQICETECRSVENLPLVECLQHLKVVLGARCHPNLAKWVNGLPSLSCEQSTQLLKYTPDHQQGQHKEVEFNSIKVDDVTLKALGECIMRDSVISFKFVNNDLSDSNLLNLIELIHLNVNLAKLTFNSNKNRIIRLLEIGNFKNVVFLCLKANEITDRCLESLAENLSGTTSRLRFLDLYGNRLTVGAMPRICQMVATYNIEYIGLGKNHFGSLANVSPLVDMVKMFQLTELQKQELNRLTADKKLLDEMVAKKKKPLKRLLDSKFPTDIVEQDGVHYRVRQPGLRLLNLIDNGFSGNKQEVSRIMGCLYPRTHVSLQLNAFKTCALGYINEALPNVSV